MFEEYQEVFFFYILVQKRIVKICGSLLKLEVQLRPALKDITNNHSLSLCTVNHLSPFHSFVWCTYQCSFRFQ